MRIEHFGVTDIEDYVTSTSRATELQPVPRTIWASPSNSDGIHFTHQEDSGPAPKSHFTTDLSDHSWYHLCYLGDIKNNHQNGIRYSRGMKDLLG